MSLSLHNAHVVLFLDLMTESCAYSNNLTEALEYSNRLILETCPREMLIRYLHQQKATILSLFPTSSGYPLPI